MKYLRLFQTVAEKEAATLDYPNVNYTIENDSLEIIAEDPVQPFGGLTVKYNIEDPTVEVTLFNGGGGSSTSSSTSGSGSGSGGGGALPTRMIVDGVEETPINTWRFETAGEHIVQYEFADNIIPAGFLVSISIATEAIIGDDITEISYDSGTNIGAFTNSGLTTATIGNGVTTIGQDAFAGCMSLTSVTIGTGITTIGEYAFADSNLETLTVKADYPPVLYSYALTASVTAIYVPASAVDVYKESTSTGWYQYASIIQAIS